MITSRILARNTVWNLIGQAFPVLAAIVAIPFLIRGLGTDRFGVLTLAWMLIGYFSLFDLGLGRALTKIVAEKIGEGRVEDAPTLIWTALSLLLLLGFLAAVLAASLASLLVHSVLNIPSEIRDESLTAFYLLAASIPAVIATVGIRGVLEAHQRFDLVNAVRIPMGMLNYIGPLIVLSFSRSLVGVVVVLVLARIVSCMIHSLLCVKVVPALLEGIAFRRRAIRPLLVFGSWMTVTNIIGPLMVYMDRFLIGALLSIAAVAYYATPYEIVTRLWIIPWALVNVLFPAFAATFVADRTRTTILFERGVKCIFLVMFPIVLLVVVFANEGLELWIGEKFAHNSTGVLQWLSVGVFINSLAKIAFALVQGLGRPDITAKLHLGELMLYLPALWWLTQSYGIEGAAIIWTVRVMLDAILLFAVALHYLPSLALFVRRMAFVASAGLLAFAAGSVLTGVPIKLIYSSLVLAAFCLISWFAILGPEERGKAREWLTMTIMPHS
jgi:O-antigen/teichoic acid export membrane protein